MNRENETPVGRLTDSERRLLKTWSSMPAPDEERLADLTVPLPERRINVRNHSRHRLRTAGQHFVTGLLLFVAGYFLGQSGQASPGDGAPYVADSSASSVAPAQVEPVMPTQAITSPGKHPSSVASAEAQPAPDPVRATDVARAASSQQPQSPDCKAPQVYQGKDGRFRIDTVLCETGSRATWVINPSLELASGPSDEPEIKQ